MKRILALLLIGILIISASFAEEKNLNMVLDLKTDSSDEDIWTQNIGFTQDKLDDSFSASTSVSPKTDDFMLSVASSAQNGGISIEGSGDIYVFWQIISPYKISASLKSAALKIENDETSSIDWSTSWTAKHQTADSPNKAVANGLPITFSKDNGYGGEGGSEVFVHDGGAIAISSYGYVKLPIKTENAAAEKAGQYKTQLTLVITTDKGSAGSN